MHRTWLRWTTIAIAVMAVGAAAKIVLQRKPVVEIGMSTLPPVERSKDPNLPPAFGPVASKVYVIVYSDFVCSVCARAAADTRRIVDEWPGDVRLEFHQIAPSVHQGSDNAAVAALAAHRQGKFWEMHDLLFANRPAFDVESLRSYAQQLGLDMERYDQDFADPKLHERVQKESNEMIVLSETGTPSFVINGKYSIGWGSWHILRDQVEEELKAVNALLAEGVPLAEAHARRAREVAKDDAAFALWNDLVIARIATDVGG